MSPDAQRNASLTESRACEPRASAGLGVPGVAIGAATGNGAPRSAGPPTAQPPPLSSHRAAAGVALGQPAADPNRWLGRQRRPPRAPRERRWPQKAAAQRVAAAGIPKLTSSVAPPPRAHGSHRCVTSHGPLRRRGGHRWRAPIVPACPRWDSLSVTRSERYRRSWRVGRDGR